MYDVMDRTTSVPKSVLGYELDKVRSLDLETSLSQSLKDQRTYNFIAKLLNETMYITSSMSLTYLSGENYG